MGKIAAGRRKAPVEKVIFLAFVAALLIKIFFIDFMIAEGYSMMPAIQPGTVLLVSRVFYGLRLPGAADYFIQWRVPRIGEIVVFYTPMGDIAVKRLGRILPGGMFHALGDNAPQSYDSRNYGPVPKRNIIGRVLGVR